MVRIWRQLRGRRTDRLCSPVAGTDRTTPELELLFGPMLAAEQGGRYGRAKIPLRHFCRCRRANSWSQPLIPNSNCWNSAAAPVGSTVARLLNSTDNEKL